jgi:hypothetical protein
MTCVRRRNAGSCSIAAALWRSGAGAARAGMTLLAAFSFSGANLAKSSVYTQHKRGYLSPLGVLGCSTVVEGV